MTCSFWSKGTCGACLFVVDCAANIDGENPDFIVQRVYRGQLLRTSFEYYLKNNPEIEKLAIEQAKRILHCDECRRLLCETSGETTG